MSIASRHGKLRITAEDDGTRFQRLEDLLTADVFGAFRYLPPNLGVRPFLEHARSPDGVSLRAWAEERGVRWLDLSRATYVFWPRLADSPREAFRRPRVRAPAHDQHLRSGAPRAGRPAAHELVCRPGDD